MASAGLFMASRASSADDKRPSPVDFKDSPADDKCSLMASPAVDVSSVVLTVLLNNVNGSFEVIKASGVEVLRGLPVNKESVEVFRASPADSSCSLMACPASAGSFDGLRASPADDKISSEALRASLADNATFSLMTSAGLFKALRALPADDKISSEALRASLADEVTCSLMASAGLFKASRASPADDKRPSPEDFRTSPAEDKCSLMASPAVSSVLLTVLLNNVKGSFKVVKSSAGEVVSLDVFRASPADDSCFSMASPDATVSTLEALKPSDEIFELLRPSL